MDIFQARTTDEINEIRELELECANGTHINHLLPMKQELLPILEDLMECEKIPFVPISKLKLHNIDFISGLEKLLKDNNVKYSNSFYLWITKKPKQVYSQLTGIPEYQCGFNAESFCITEGFREAFEYRRNNNINNQ